VDCDLEIGDKLVALLKRYLDNHCANADVEGMSVLCECKLCLDTRALIKEGDMTMSIPDIEKAEGASCVWYGPHPCGVCGETIVKAALESGGAEFDVPEILMRVYDRGSEARNPGLVYPMVWKPHVHVMKHGSIPGSTGVSAGRLIDFNNADSPATAQSTTGSGTGAVSNVLYTTLNPKDLELIVNTVMQRMVITEMTRKRDEALVIANYERERSQKPKNLDVDAITDEIEQRIVTRLKNASPLHPSDL
jgi:hypothetical protein